MPDAAAAPPATSALGAEAERLDAIAAFAGGIAHDFNNLLVGVLANASLALLDLAPDHPARVAVEDIERAAHRAADLTRQLLAFSGQGRYVAEPLDLSQLVHEMADLLRAAIARKVELRLELSGDLPKVTGDPTQLRLVVTNLISNASDAMLDAGGVLRIATSLARSPALEPGEVIHGVPFDGRARVCVEVADQGVGMSPDALRHVFEAFYTTKFTGRGLGIPASVGVVRQHGGAMSIRSTVGVGTTVRLWLPLIAEKTPEPVAAVAGPSGGIILVVDDDDGVRRAARALLTRRGFRVLEAEDGREGVKRFREAGRELRAVILDLVMPVMGGAEAFAIMRNERPDLPVLLMSGYAQHTMEKTLGANEAKFLQKPFLVDEFYAAVASTLDHAVP